MAGNPYVGARPLTHDQRIFGRDRERREIVDLLIAERVVLLHAPSGAGKTSLIQGRGGIVDTLRDESFAVLPVARVGLSPSDHAHADRYTESLFTSLDLEAGGGATLDASLGELTARHPEALGLVLIVDQFEEVLTVDPTGEHERVAFFHALGRALGHPRLWVLLAMREEYLGALAPYRPRVPTCLRATYRLDLLAREAAREAIVRPARDAGVPFTEAAADKLVEELCMVAVPRPDGTVERKPGMGVEPVQLQVVCHRLWLRRDPASQAIAEGDVSGVDSVDAALAEFYAAAVAEAVEGSGESERRLRDWIGEDLITAAGVRGQVMRYSGRDPRVHDEAVRRLVDAYVLRQDSRRGVEWIEIVHDRLVSPIVQNNAAWRREHLNVVQKQAAIWEERGRGEDLCLRGAALAEAERWAASQPRELTPIEGQYLAASRKVQRAERAAATLQRALLSIAFAVAVLMAALGSWAWREKRDAERQRKAERVTRLMATARELLANDHPSWAMKLLLHAGKVPEHLGWIDLANEVLNAGGPLVTAPGGVGHRTLAVFSPDGTKVLNATSDKAAKVWNADGWGTPVAFVGHDDDITSAAWSSDGQKIVTASSDRTIRVWNADGSGTTAILRGHTNKVEHVSFSSDATKIVSASDDGTTRVWNADGTGTAVVFEANPNGPIAAFSPDGKKIVTTSNDNIARVWNADHTGTPIVLQGHTDTLLSVAFSPDGERIATSSKDGTARIWNADGKGKSRVLGHDDAVYKVVFSLDGATIATASADWTARLWSVRGSQEPIVLRGHTGPVRSVAFAPNGRYVVTASEDNTARVWNADEFREPTILRGHQSAVLVAAFSSDGTRIVTGSDDMTVRVWDARGSGIPIAGIRATVASSYAFSPDFKRIIVQGLGDGTARVRSIDGSSETVPLNGHEGKVRWAAFSPDGKRVVTASEDRTARVWNADGSGNPVVLRGHTDIVLRAAFSADGKRIVTASQDGTARVWNADGSGLPIVLEGHKDRVINAVFSPDGLRILTGSDDYTARVWDAGDGHELLVLRGHTDSVQALAFSQDGQKIVTGGYDNEARVWNADGSGGPIVFEGHEGPVVAAVFSADAKRIATGSDDCTARVWNADGTGRHIVLRGHAFSVRVVAFDASDQRVISISWENKLKVWSLYEPELKHDLENASADCFPPGERIRYLDEPAATARDRFATCERDHGRAPTPPTSS